MANINEILARAAALRDETALNSISPKRAGGIMYDTLMALNELWLQQGAALVISKIYASVDAMEADTNPVSDISGKPLRPGQIVVIASEDEDNGSVYRYNGTDSPSWSLVGNIGNLEPVDSLDSDSTQLPLAAHQGKVLDDKISQLGQEKEIILNKTFDSSGNLVSSDTKSVSPYIEMPASLNVRVSPGASAASVYCVYNSDKEYLAQQSIAAGSGTAVNWSSVQPTAKYIRVAFNTNDSDGFVRDNTGGTLGEYLWKPFISWSKAIFDEKERAESAEAAINDSIEHLSGNIETNFYSNAELIHGFIKESYTNVNTRATTKSLLQAPFSLTIDSNYVLYQWYRYTLDGTYLNDTMPVSVTEVTDTNYLYRPVFCSKTSYSTPIPDSDLPNIIASFDCQYETLKKNVFDNIPIFNHKFVNQEIEAFKTVDLGIEVGGINWADGQNNNNLNFGRLAFNIDNTRPLEITINSDHMYFYTGFVYASDTSTEKIGAWDIMKKTALIEKNGYIRVTVKRDDGANLTSEDLASTITVRPYPYSDIMDSTKAYERNRMNKLLVANANGVPTNRLYYGADYKRMNVLFFTDCHLFSYPTAVNKQNVIDIVDYANRSEIPISAIVCGGDVISFNSGDASAETKKFYMAQLEEFFAIAKQSNVPFIFTKGNHDLVDTYPATVLDDDDWGDLWLDYAEEKFGIVRQTKANGKKSTWHYYDDTTSKVRFISLDCYDLDKSITDGDGKVLYWGGTSEYFSNEQFNWVINTALNFDDKDEKDWGVIVTFHNYEDKVWGTGIAPLYENALDKMSKIFNAFNTQSTYSNTYSFQYSSFDLNFSADFTRYASLEKKPYFITCLIGHTHYDTYLTSDNIVKIKSENTACYHASTCDSRVARIPGTNSQNCFDVVNVDTVTQKIRAFRYGAGLNCFCEGGDRFLPDGLDYKTCYVGFSKGPSSHRPIGIHDSGNGNYVGQLRPIEDVGFAYYDTDLSKNIYASEINSNSGVVTWKDALGNTL